MARCFGDKRFGRPAAGGARGAAARGIIMARSRHSVHSGYAKLISTISSNIRKSRYFAANNINRELLRLYFSTGKLLSERIKPADWGDKVLDTISEGIQHTFPGIRGFSIRNLYNMRRFYDTYASFKFLQLPTAQLVRAEFLQSSTAENTMNMQPPVHCGVLDGKTIAADVFLSVSFTHHLLLLQKCSDIAERFFYIQAAACNQWSVPVLQYHVESNFYRRRGKLEHNFQRTLPSSLKQHALEAFKDEYFLDFITVTDNDAEKVLEDEIVKNIQRFLMSLGREFAYLGRQYRILVDDEEFFVDLLFYHRRLQSLIAVDLKAGRFKPEYAGKMNFYLEALDRYVKLPLEKPSIGIILCKEKKSTIVEFAFKRVARPMGVATYVYNKKLPPELRRYLPSPEELKKAAVSG
jgi:predicted nuclease of restriction endonuclease-like (RecB) superfamily